MESFIDKLSAGLPQEQLDEIENLYKQGLEHETKFNLSQQINGQKVVVPLCKQLDEFSFPVISNFDLCCTKSSSDLKRLEDYEKLIANELLKIDPPGKQKLPQNH